MSQSVPPAVWDQVLARLKTQVPPRSFETWIRPISLLSAGDDEVSLGVPSHFFLDWIEEHFRPAIEKCWRDESGRSVRLRISVDEAGAHEVPPERALPLVTSPRPQQSRHLRHTFEHFVVGPSNEFAFAAAMAVVDQPGLVYNPLFIYGGVGLGKTHLLRAISHQICARRPDARVSYVSSEKFMVEMIHAIRRGNTIDFKRRYRGLDVLLIDDVQFLSGKDSTQEEFFHTFNSLYDARKQIVISADCPPKEIKGLEERLSSRVGWGLVTDIQPPNFETRVAILRKLAELKSIPLADEVAFLIASNVRSNIRELEGCLTRLEARAHATGRHVDTEFAEQTLADLFSSGHHALSSTRILDVVSNVFEVPREVLISKKRTQSVALPRQVAMFFMRTHTSLSLVEIGRRVGDRDHSTVLHACSKIDRLKTEDAEVRARMAEVARKLGVQ